MVAITASLDHLSITNLLIHIDLKAILGLCPTQDQEIILEALSKIGLNSKLFGLHSLRSGGATSAANAGVPDRVFKRHKRWRSENVKDGYIKDDLKALLSVSSALGI